MWRNIRGSKQELEFDESYNCQLWMSQRRRKKVKLLPKYYGREMIFLKGWVRYFFFRSWTFLKSAEKKKAGCKIWKIVLILGLISIINQTSFFYFLSNSATKCKCILKKTAQFYSKYCINKATKVFTSILARCFSHGCLIQLYFLRWT